VRGQEISMESVEQKEHEHKWTYYDGCLGYESFICAICKKDINDEYHKGEL